MLASLRPESFVTDDGGLGDDALGPPPAANDASARFGAPPPFTRLELLVIGIGERDGPVKPANGRWARLRRALFGIEGPQPFADARLEALRVLAGSPREGRARDAAIAAALAAGISRSQIDHLRSSRPRNPKG